MVAEGALLVFGSHVDSSYEFQRQALTLERSNVLSTSFVTRVVKILQEEIAKLPADERRLFPHFTNLRELLDQYHHSKTRILCLETSLLYVSQILQYLRLASTDTFRRVKEQNIVLVGLGVGSFAASTVSSAPSSADVVSLAFEITRVAFRVGVLVGRAARNIVGSSTKEQHWAVQVFGLTEADANKHVQNYNEQNVSPNSGNVAVIAVGFKSVTFGGTPDVLESFVTQNNLRAGNTVQSLPVQGYWHAESVKSQIYIEDILGDVEAFENIHTILPVLSACSGETIEASDVANLLNTVLSELLYDTIRLDRIKEGCVKVISRFSHSAILLLGVGAPKVVDALLNNLKPGSEANLVAEINDQSEQARGHPDELANCKLAIVGMSGRFPSSGDHHKFWELLMKGIDAHREVPADRFAAQTYYDPAGKLRNTSHTPFGCFIDDPGMFDPRFFNMSPREAAQTDPMQRLGLVTAAEALEMAGIVPNSTPSTRADRIGTFYGQTSDDWREINAAQDIDVYFITGGVRAFGPGRINYYFKFSGPSLSIDTACSSSMAALQVACTSLQAGECDTAITGGLNVLTNPDIFCGLSRGGFLSKVGPCQTFDEEADGYCRADGVGSVIIKRLQDAEADNDNILAIILGTATNHSAEAVSITHPHAGTQEFLYRKILDKAGVDALDVDYVEMHGTGTQAGDGTEMESVLNVFAPPHLKRRADQTLHLGAVKANVGHGEAASGVTALIKCLTMLQMNKVPPHVGVKRKWSSKLPDDLEERNIQIAFGGSREFPRRADRNRLVFVNNFSAAGGNTGLLLEEAAPRDEGGRDPRSTHVVTVSAAAKSSLKWNIERLLQFIRENNVRLQDIAYTTTARRVHYNYRIAVTASDIPELEANLTRALSEMISGLSGQKAKVAFVFTGQGSQYPALAQSLYLHESHFRAEIDSLNRIAVGLGFPSFMPLINAIDIEASLASPQVTQLAVTCVQIALVKLWRSWGVEPDFVIGHSLGEYAALYAAGVLSAHDTIYLVGSRAALLNKWCTANSHAMLAVKAAVDCKDKLPAELASKLEVACVNGPNDTVLGGTASDIMQAQSFLTSAGIRNTKVDVSYAFHTAQVDDLLSDFAQNCKDVRFSKPKMSLFSTLTGKRLDTTKAIDGDYLCRHAREKADFLSGVHAIQKAGLVDDSTVWIELGPHPVCSGMVKAVLGPKAPTFASLRKGEDDWKVLAQSLASLHIRGIPVAWQEYHGSFVQNLRLVDLPRYAFDEKNYWIQYERDWTLSKGAPHPRVQIEDAAPQAAPARISALSTTSVHRVIKENFKGGDIVLEIESDISRPDLHAVAVGHLINGQAMCPSSLYGDMVMTMANYMHKAVKPDQDLSYDVRSMEVTKPLIIDLEPKGPRLLRVTATSKNNLQSATIKFTSLEGSTSVEHATCLVVFEDPKSWLQTWSKISYLIDGRVKFLKSGVNAGKTHKIMRGMAYKLFAALVDYDKKFRGMDEVVLDSDNMEATAKIVFQTNESHGSFYCSPYWIDSLAHISGFIVNASDALDSISQVYISHGWESMRFAKRITAEQKYQSYVRMQPGDAKVMVGDVYIFDEANDIVGMVGGLKFQCIPRKVFNMMLPPIGSRAIEPAARSEAKPAKKAAVVEESKLLSAPAATPTMSQPKAGAKSIISMTLDIIAEEMGIDVDELDDPIVFANMGCDSLMSLSISGRMREELDVNVHSHAFVEYPTVGQLKQYLRKFEAAAEPEADVASSSSSEEGVDSARTIGTPITPASDTEEEIVVVSHKNKPVEVVKPVRKATSVLLQGSPKRATQILWMFPDGGGSATSYVAIPDLSPEIAVYGLNSPYMKTPEEYVESLHEVTKKMVSELRTKQPNGPYCVAGWSAGGVVAYEACQQLIAAGEKIEKLLLIDSPCPTIIEPLPSTLHLFFNDIGLLGDGQRENFKTPDWLLPHFAASIRALSSYDASPIAKDKRFKTLAIWCEYGICKDENDIRPDPYPYGHAQWLLETKENYGPDHWDEFLGIENMTMDVVPGNHFTMMRSPNIELLGAAMAKFLLN